jgi:hypothetical protein
MSHRVLAVLAVLILGVFTALGANAQQQPGPVDPPVPQAGQPQQTDSDVGVARASFIHGDVSMQRADSGDASPVNSAVTLNTPLMAGDKISTGDASRTELQLDFANVLRLDERAQANIATLTRSHIQIQLAQGLANYSVLRGSEADVEIDTPNVSVHPQREGQYRIRVNGDGETEVIVRDGQADVSTPQGSTQVHKGEQINIEGVGNDAQYRVISAPGSDDWDRWNSDRDHIITNAGSVQHTNPYYTGSQDLDPYGVWSEVPDYGQVWTPTVGADWAPYRDGRWVWEPYWGWTWVSYEPWGWAPYHYGRWFLNGGRWGWWPGPVYGGYRPIWAPAYVSFFGFGGGVGIGFGLGFGGFGSIGWLPIGPGDYFHPWWGGFRGRFNVVDIHDIHNVHEGFAPLHGGDRFSNLRDFETNDRLRGGISSVSSRNFGRGVEAARGVSASDLRGARAMTGSVPVTPSRESMRASERPVNSQAFSARANQQFFSGRTPPAAAVGARAQGQGFAGWPPQGQTGGGNQQSGGWQRFSQQQGSAAANRGEGAGQSGNFQSSRPGYRPPLDMNKPIVNQNQRSFGGSNGGNRGDAGGNNSAPSYRGAPAPTYRNDPAPSYRGAPAPTYRSAPPPAYRGEPAPSYRGAPAPTYRSAPAPAPSYRAPSGGFGGGGGGSHGGGGGGGGGSHGGGGGGGSRSSGGGGGHRR